jgi:small-conductance mechanosensitive channel
LLIWTVLLAAVLMGERWLSARFPDSPLARFLGGAGEYWSQPFFHIGTAAVSPSFLFKALAYLALLFLFARGSRMFLRANILNRMDIGEGQRFAAERVFGYLVVVVGLFVGLETLGIDLRSLTVVGGAIGIGIGFGLQNIANNFISGIILLIERPIQVGDRIEVGNLSGDVVRIGSRSTWIRTNENIVIIVPNSDFISHHVINWTANDRRVRFAVKVQTAYGSDPEQVREVLKAAAASVPGVLREPAPDVWFTNFGESSLEFELRVWTDSRTHQPGRLRSELRYVIHAALKRAGIEIPFPQRVVHLRRSAPDATTDR